MTAAPIKSKEALRKRPQRGDARRAILDSTLKLVRRQGWAATSVDEICSSAGVTKGAFFHHFPTKEALGVAAAKHWEETVGPFFAEGGSPDLTDPLDRIFAYLDFRAEIARTPLEATTCFAGTMVQEVFATSPSIRDACGATIRTLTEPIAGELRAAVEKHGLAERVSAESLATYIQTVLQGGFIMAKAENDPAPLVEAITHLKRYIAMLFARDAPDRLPGRPKTGNPS